MSMREEKMLDHIERLRIRIERLRSEIWEHDRFFVSADDLVSRLEEVLREYLEAIRNHENYLSCFEDGSSSASQCPPEMTA